MKRTLQLAYCEDEIIQITVLQTLAEKIEKKMEFEVSIIGFASAEAFLFEHPKHYPYDGILLDIDMKQMNGMELARIIRKNDEEVPIIFLTNERTYVFEGYEVKALRYLLKPVTEDSLTGIFQEILSRAGKEHYYLIDRQDRETVKIDLDQVCYMEVKGHYLNLCCQDHQAFVLKKSLQEIQKLLEEDFGSLFQAGFVMTHRSYLVNLKYVERITRMGCFMDQGASIPISRTLYQKVNAEFLEYYKSKTRSGT